MNDVMQLARVRQKELTITIAKRETEIAKLREDIESWDMFIRLGEDLLNGASRQTVQDSTSGIDDQDELQTASDPIAPKAVRVKQPA